ncbi:MAG: 3'-5' exonuclease [Clostridia bacterium]|nr:3'-5' exonuclease [Clostridia bacterium]MBQ6182400.1 3'-5' exonuclease [Clostridia bacterium]
MRYVVIDTETPNMANDRMSSIGIVVVENREIVYRFGTLIDPETYFSPFNVQLTGINPESVCGMPTFGDLWHILRPILESGVIVAHNAVFDLCVLAKCLNAYNIVWRDTVPYLCTVRLSRSVFPSVRDHKLNTLCDHFGIELDHHRADSDSAACAGILIKCMETCADVNSFIRTFRLVK